MKKNNSTPNKRSTVSINNKNHQNSFKPDELFLFFDFNRIIYDCKQKFVNYELIFHTQKWIFALLFSLNFLILNAQENANPQIAGKSKVTILNIDTKGVNIDPVAAGNLVRIELEKLNQFQIMDRYDVAYVIDKNKLSVQNCYGKICLVEIGKVIGADKMFTGSIELIGETIIVTFRMIDVKNEQIERTHVNEFLNFPNEMQTMVQVSIAQMFEKPVPDELLTTITKRNNYENSINNMNRSKVNLSGPRSGFTYFTGEAGRRISEDRSTGGFGSYPMMFQFGYQFEVQYLNEGNYQALFEFLPTISGFNQNIFFPSLTIMNGFRNNKYGWEIAFGPTLGLVTKAKGYYDADNNWQLASEWDETLGENPYKVETRMDSRGNFELQAGFIVAAGKTFKSGKLNIPVNLYMIPNKQGIRFGASFGFNAKRKK